MVLILGIVRTVFDSKELIRGYFIALHNQYNNNLYKSAPQTKNRFVALIVGISWVIFEFIRITIKKSKLRLFSAAFQHLSALSMTS